MSSMPTVVLIGRMNVGKSTLFNRISKKERAITLDYEGVTRDFLRETIRWHSVPFDLIDTGGISLKKVSDPIMEQVRQKALELVHHADAVLFMVDGTTPLTLAEKDLARWLHKAGRPVIVVINKTDVKQSQEFVGEYEQLGFAQVLPISAAHNRGVNELLDQVIQLLPRAKIQKAGEQRLCKVTLLGRPNVGKSSLMNQLLKKERTIVTDIPGTTREAITDTLQFYAQTIELTDTAGVRRSRKVDEPLEELMVKSSLKAVRDADIIVLVGEAQEGRLTDQELKLAFYAFEQGKAVILAINKSDLLEKYTQEQWKDHCDYYDFFYNKVERVFISCKDGTNIGKLVPLIAQVRERYLSEFDSDDLTKLFKQELIHRPLHKQKQRIAIINARQVKTGPPTILLKVENPKLFGERECAYFQQILRAHYSLKSVPIFIKMSER